MTRLLFIFSNLLQTVTTTPGEANPGREAPPKAVAILGSRPPMQVVMWPIQRSWNLPPNHVEVREKSEAKSRKRRFPCQVMEIRTRAFLRLLQLPGNLKDLPRIAQNLIKKIHFLGRCPPPPQISLLLREYLRTHQVKFFILFHESFFFEN